MVMTGIKVQPAIYQPIQDVRVRARVEGIVMVTEGGGVPFGNYPKALTTI